MKNFQNQDAFEGYKIVFILLIFINTLFGCSNTQNGIESDEKILEKVIQVYNNYSQMHPNCGYQPNPSIVSHSQSLYTLTNPYMQDENEIRAINFKIRNFILDGVVTDSDNPYCGQLSIKCAAYLASFDFYCERIHFGSNSDPVLLSDPRYNYYLAYQTIYNLSVIPIAKKNFGLLKQFYDLDAFQAYANSKLLPPKYDYTGVIYSTFKYPDPTNPPSQNYNNAKYGFLFIGSAENLKSICRTIQSENLLPADVAIRFNQYLGIPPDSPDMIRTFTFVNLRNTPHAPGEKDGNIFRPCPVDGNIQTYSCSASALTIPHDCTVIPDSYDGTTVGSFLANQFYSSYCYALPNKNSGMPIYFPWTGQGFTYDWYPWHKNLMNMQGTSEYVPATNSGDNNIAVIANKSVENFVKTCEF